MDITVLKEHIMKHNLSNFYIFTGTEIGIQKIYLEQMSKVLGMPITRVDTVASVYRSSTTKSLFGSVAKLYVVRGDTDFPKHEDVYTQVFNRIGKSVLVLLYDRLDSRLKFGKFFKDSIVVFDKLAPNILNAYIKKECPLSADRIEDLSNKVSGIYDIAMLEADKIKHYSEATGVDVNKSFDILVEQKTIYQQENSDVFEFTGAVCRGDAGESVRLANILADNKVSAINILGTLYNSLKTVMLIQVCNGENVCEVTGLDNRQVYFNKRYVGVYSSDELVNAVKLLAKVISGIKGGWIDEKYAVLYSIVKIL